MTTMLRIIQAEYSEHIETVPAIFREYESWLDMDLCFQGFEEELQTLPGRYEPPDGRLYIASADEKPAGCIAMRKLEDGICEMKRLYLRSAFRGQGIGNALIEKLIDEARSAGYERMRLDTHPPKMGKAVSLYESYGFRPIPPYYENPNDGVLFMELVL